MTDKERLLSEAGQEGYKAKMLEEIQKLRREISRLHIVADKNRIVLGGLSICYWLLLIVLTWRVW